MTREYKEFSTKDTLFSLPRLVGWLSSFKYSILFSSSGDHFQHHWNLPECDILAACGALSVFSTPGSESLQGLADYHQQKKDWIVGHFSYDLKNELEALSSIHPDHVGFPVIHFFQPEYLLMLKGTRLRIFFSPEHGKAEDTEMIFADICSWNRLKDGREYQHEIHERMSKDEYLEKVKSLKNHIKRGDVYEVNLCQEFYSEEASIHPAVLYVKLTEASPAPFSCWYRLHDQYLICASPERFLQKTGTRIISQPIKGTAPRGNTRDEDLQIIQKLRNDPKERSENIMIVDLVRNDLSRIADRGTVNVEELCGIYSFPQVHQMISTVTARLDSSKHWTEVIGACFPMGSMTGAPKIRAMELIEAFEESKRGLYSGSVGFVTPEGDFDFNVVIRSVFFNSKLGYLSFHTGGAITWESDPVSEYKECLLKGTGIMKVLGGCLKTGS
jgi:para-aminobenzoate synthetase component I